MKKDNSEKRKKGDQDMLPQYNFEGGERGKHYRAFREGYTLTIHESDGTTVTHDITPVEGAVILEPDVRQYFPDSESVNKTLRAIIDLIPKKLDNHASPEH